MAKVPGVTKYLSLRNLPIKAVFLINNATTYPEECKLTKRNIPIKFLPSNVTMLEKPMEKEVLQNTKKVYKLQF